jgi:hypothetical protein
MRIIDMSKYTVVDSGQTWPYETRPCREEMLPLLEQNESIVTWIQPNGSTDVDEQIPVIRIKRNYYSVSLRMMKSMWRHVRLASDFVNRDTGKNGCKRLRIPNKLYIEKRRTQSRFMVPARGERARLRGAFARTYVEFAHPPAVDAEPSPRCKRRERLWWGCGRGGARGIPGSGSRYRGKGTVSRRHPPHQGAPHL